MRHDRTQRLGEQTEVLTCNSQLQVCVTTRWHTTQTARDHETERAQDSHVGVLESSRMPAMARLL